MTRAADRCAPILLRHALAALGLIWAWQGSWIADAYADDKNPIVASYLTDTDAEVYVALFDGIGVELKGCPSRGAAIDLLQLPDTTPVREDTRAGLVANHDLGSHPAIPCGAQVPFDDTIDAQAPIWADLGGSGRYFIEFPAASGKFYTVPQRCTRLKDALGLRQRISRPGVLQAESGPPASRVALRVDYACGEVVDTGGGTPDDGGAVRPPGTPWQLFQTEVFLSADSLGDWIYVAVYETGHGEQRERFLLPIHRIDGERAHDIIWEGSARTERIENQLATVFGIDPEANVAGLGFDDLRRIRLFPFVAMCVEECDNPAAVFDHAYFLQPGVDLELTAVTSRELTPRVDLVGDTYLQWRYGPGRALDFAGCPALGRALGLREQPSRAGDWFATVDAALAAQDNAIPVYRCLPRDPSELCVRHVTDGNPVTQRLLEPDSDCAGARRLRIEISGTAHISDALIIDAGNGISTVEITSGDPQARARLVATSLPARMPFSSSCMFDTFSALITVDNSATLAIRDIDVALAEELSAASVLAVHAEHSVVSLARTRIGSTESASVPPARGVRLCGGRLYAYDTSIVGAEVALHGMHSDVLVAGPADGRAVLGAEHYAVFLNRNSRLRLHRTDVSGRRTLQLRDASLYGSFAALQPRGPAAGTQALRLYGEAEATLRFSTARDYACVAHFLSPNARASLVFPGNDLAAENQQLVCGVGDFNLIE